MSDRHYDRHPEAVAQVKRLAPSQLRVYQPDGGEKTVAISKGKNKWASLTTTLDAMPWDRIECLDAKGAVIGVIESDDADDYDDEDDEDMGKGHKQVRVLAGLVKATLTEARKMFQVQIDGFSKVLEAQAEAMSNLQQTHELQMRVQLAAHASEMAGRGGGDDTQMMELLKLAFMTSQMKPQPAINATARTAAKQHAPRQQRLPNVPNKPPTEAPVPPVGEGHP